MENKSPEEKVEQLLQSLLEDTDMFLVSLRIKPTNNIKVYLDADGGLSVEKSARVNRRLYARIEEAGLYPDGNYSLEVSSPGVDEPLLQLRQYIKNIGRTVEVTPLEGAEVTGILKSADEEKVVLEVKAVKKKEENTIVEIPFSFIKKTVVQVTF